MRCEKKCVNFNWGSINLSFTDLYTFLYMPTQGYGDATLTTAKAVRISYWAAHSNNAANRLT
jgi:hypothetical protein